MKHSDEMFDLHARLGNVPKEKVIIMVDLNALPTHSGYYVLELPNSGYARLLRCFPTMNEAKTFAANLGYHSVKTKIVVGHTQ